MDTDATTPDAGTARDTASDFKIVDVTQDKGFRCPSITYHYNGRDHTGLDAIIYKRSKDEGRYYLPPADREDIKKRGIRYREEHKLLPWPEIGDPIPKAERRELKKHEAPLAPEQLHEAPRVRVDDYGFEIRPALPGRVRELSAAGETTTITPVHVRALEDLNRISIYNDKARRVSKGEVIQLYPNVAQAMLERGSVEIVTAPTPPMELTEEDVLELQIQFMDVLQAFEPNRSLLYQHVTGEERWKDYHEEPPTRPFEVYTSLLKEIVYDTDAPDWSDNRTIARAIVEHLTAHEIPHYVVWTGGKGVHIHVLMSDVPLPEELAQAVREYHVDATKEIRGLLADRILRDAGVEAGTIIDRRKISFSSISKGSMVKAIGGRHHKTGARVALLETIPEDRPTDGQYPLKFPQVRAWNIAPYKKEIIAHLKGVVDRFKKRQETPLEPLKDLDALPCYKAMLAGVHEGARHHAAVAMASLLRESGRSQEDAEPIILAMVERFENTGPDQERAALADLEDVYRNDRRFSCWTFEEAVGSDYCDYVNCPRKRKITPRREELNLGTWTDATKEHTWTARAIYLEGEGAFIEYEQDGTVLTGTDGEVLRASAAMVDDTYYTQFEEAILTIERQWGILAAWPDGGRIPIGPNTFSPEAAEAHNLIIRTKGKGDKVDKDGTARYIMDRIEFAKIQIGVPEEGSETDPVRKLHYYKGGTYHTGAAGLISEILERMFPRLCTNGLVTEFIGTDKNNVMGKIGRRCKSVTSMNLDPSGWRCLENCLVKLPTLSDMEVRTAPFSPEKYFTKRLPVVWDPTQDGAEVLEFLGQVSDSDAMKQGLIEVLAWRLEPGYPHPWLLFHVGQGANGKSVYLKLLRRTLGPGYASAVPLQNLADQKDKFHKTRLYGKCSNSCEDIGHSAIKDAGELKNLSAGGRVQAEYKFGDIFEFDNEAKLEFSTNHPPLIEDDSYGIDRRVRSYPWKKEFKGEDADPNKFFKLNTPENISGLFNLALAAYKGLVERGELSGVRIGSEAITMEANAPRFFLDEECSFDEKNEDGLDRGGLFKNYLLWCKEKGVETPGTIKGFSKAIEKWFKDNHRLLLVEKSGSVNAEGKRPFMVRFMACDYVPGIDIKNAATITPPPPEEDALEDREDILEAIDTLKKAGQDGFTKTHLVGLFNDPQRGEKVFERFLTNGEIGSSSRHNGRFIWLGRPGRR